MFDVDGDGYDGRILDPVCRNPADPHRVRPTSKVAFPLVSLANMRGAGEPIFEHGFPPGTEIAGEVLAGTYKGKRDLSWGWLFD